ncbi:hypothetical protein, partial [Streptomyces griseofuscus]|uniref:hypothetical protein n=1 Tax=Streptomyces griseofuscus TaxID=146922 RepID=UPI00056CB7E3
MRAQSTRIKRVAIVICSVPILAITAGAGAAHAATTTPTAAPQSVVSYHHGGGGGGDGGWGWGDDGWGYGLSLIHISEPTRQAEISYAVFC